jgi:hypothetical protein
MRVKKRAGVNCGVNKWAIVQKPARCAGVFSALGFGHVRSLAVITIGGLQMRNLMREFLVALIFLVGTVFLLGGELFFGHLFSVPSVAIGIGAALCVLATIAKERIDRDMTTP